MAHGIRDLGNCGDEAGPFPKRADAVVGIGAPEQNPPIFDSSGIVECTTAGSLVAHRNTFLQDPATSTPCGQHQSQLDYDHRPSTWHQRTYPCRFHYPPFDIDGTVSRRGFEPVVTTAARAE